ncbi:hypothetical protein PG991_015945 [Apiospora marii]|uniref:Uncharacterized protein n=1 Tax=Apiospora marii TaxID=335849 RepID=A0ABR1R052_9PEZI
MPLVSYENARRRGVVLDSSNIEEQECGGPDQSKAGLYPEIDVDVSLMYFQKSGQGFKGTNLEEGGVVHGLFPNQATTLDVLLGDDYKWSKPENRQPAAESLEESMRYLHFPHNNMIWAELTNFAQKLLYNYFLDVHHPTEETEEHPLRGYSGPEYARRTAADITRNLYWRNQFRVQQDKPYSRRLRPLSSIIVSRGHPVISDMAHGSYTRTAEQSLIVFMPFLHWESYSKRKRYQSVVNEAVDEYDHDNSPRLKREAGIFRSQSPSTSFNLDVDLFLPRGPINREGRLTSNSPLGQYLLDAARLFNYMAEYRDTNVLRRYLMSEMPLYPRRTLEQGSHWTLRQARNNGREQVLYRATNPIIPHLYNPETRKWPDHEFAGDGDCIECREDSRKVASIVMVDQLWMWVLDANTIITCFPDQYGIQDYDWGIHKSIRARAQNTGSQLSSVFELGLIIIDECSNAAFGNTKATSNQYELVDVFSLEIEKLVGRKHSFISLFRQERHVNKSQRKRQLFLVKRYWAWVAAFELTIRTDGKFTNLTVPLSSDEGSLLEDLNDLIEELDDIMQTMKMQEGALNAFVANAEQILDPLNIFRSSTQRIYVPRFMYEKVRTPDEEQRATQEARFYSFRSHADETIARLLARIESLEGLQRTANAHLESVKNHLELKGQQASLIPALISASQAGETLQQGRVILVFTLVTIVFVYHLSLGVKCLFLTLQTRMKEVDRNCPIQGLPPLDMISFYN